GRHFSSLLHSKVNRFVVHGHFLAAYSVGELQFSARLKKMNGKAKKRWCGLRNNFFYYFGSKAVRQNQKKKTYSRMLTRNATVILLGRRQSQHSERDFGA